MWIIWPFRKKNFGSALSVYADFRAFVEAGAGKFVIQDEDRLPHPKTSIFEAICILLMTEADARTRETAHECAFELAFFQKGVGDKPLHPLGIDIDTAEIAQVDADRLSREADPAARQRYDHFKLLRDADWAKMRATMSQIRPRSASQP